MNGRLQGFLNFLDLLAEGQRRQAELVTGRRFEPVAGLAPVQARTARPAPRVDTRH
jgi:hypothetical protein